jgi:hypothetical protein
MPASQSSMSSTAMGMITYGDVFAPSREGTQGLALLKTPPHKSCIRGG